MQYFILSVTFLQQENQSGAPKRTSRVVPKDQFKLQGNGNDQDWLGRSENINQQQDPYKSSRSAILRPKARFFKSLIVSSLYLAWAIWANRSRSY